MRSSSPASAIARSSARGYGPSPTSTQRQRPRGNQPAEWSRSAASACGEHVKALVLLEPSRRSAARPRRRRCPPPRRTRRRRPASPARRAIARSMRVRDGDDPVARRRRGAARTAGSSDRSVAITAIGGARAGDAPPAAAAGRRARFSRARDGSVAPNSSSPCGLRTSGAGRVGALPRVAEHARAEAVDDVDVAARDELERDAPGALAEQRIRGAAIDHRRAAPSGERKGAVRHGTQRARRVDRRRPSRAGSRLRRRA